MFKSLIFNSGLAVICCAALDVGAVSAPVAQAVEAKFFKREPDRMALQIDGQLDDWTWREAAALDKFYLLGAKDPVADADTTVKIAYDRQWLYFAVDCINREREFERNAETEHDGNVLKDDSLELFITADPARAVYYHFMLNCNNTKKEQKVTGKGDAGRRDLTWNPVWLSTTARSTNGWRAEIAIPLELLAQNGKVGPLSFNICRNKLIPEYDDNAVRIGERRELSSLFPVKHSFHEPESFIELSGLEAVAVQEASKLKLVEASPESYASRDGRAYYDVVVKLHCGSATHVWAEVAVQDLPENGPATAVSEKICLAAGAQQSLLLSVPVADLGARSAAVILKDHATGGVIERQMLNLDKLTPLQAYFRRNYYTAEPAAELVCRIALPPAALGDAALAVYDVHTNVLFQASGLAAENLFALDLSRLPAGASRLTAVLSDSSGNAMFQQPLTFIKRVPKPGHEWKIDHLNGVLLNNGEPFFPLGAFFRYTTTNILDLITELGFNMFIKWDDSFPDDIYAQAQQRGLYVIDRLESYSQRRKAPDMARYFTGQDLLEADIQYASETMLQSVMHHQPLFRKLTRQQRNEIFDGFYRANRPGYIAGVRKIMNHENLMGYDTIDEPMFGVLDLFYQLRDIYRLANDLDGYHPMMVLYSSHIPPGPEATDACDILATDPYWVPDGVMPGRNSVNFVAQITAMTKARADAVRKMTLIVPAGDYWSATHRRTFLPSEQLCQSYLALIHGAKGIVYYGISQHKLLRDAIKTFTSQARTMLPALLAPPVSYGIQYRPVDFKPDKNQFPAVQAALFQYPERGLLLLAANTTERQILTHYTLAGIPAGAKVQRLFAAETIAADDGVFSDSLEPLGTRAYLIPAAEPRPETLHLMVESAPDETASVPPARSPTIDCYGRTGKKNIAPNPSFEEATVPDIPDYYRPVGKTLIGFDDAHMKLVDEHPVHGKVCLRFDNREEATLYQYVGFQMFCAPQHDQAETYTWSLYMKSDTGNVPVLFGSHWMQSGEDENKGAAWKNVEVTREWKRYTLTGVVPPHVYRKCGLELQVRGYGTVWIDAVQFEKGATPTEFEP
ncbi:MAG: carbohydrate-binding family 9-like protein [Kiritimatiellia bacterium]|jgi:hypothetical protein